MSLEKTLNSKDVHLNNPIRSLDPRNSQCNPTQQERGFLNCLLLSMSENAPAKVVEYCSAIIQ